MCWSWRNSQKNFRHFESQIILRKNHLKPSCLHHLPQPGLPWPISYLPLSRSTPTPPPSYTSSCASLVRPALPFSLWVGYLFVLWPMSSQNAANVFYGVFVTLRGWHKGPEVSLDCAVNDFYMWAWIWKWISCILIQPLFPTADFGFSYGLKLTFQIFFLHYQRLSKSYRILTAFISWPYIVNPLRSISSCLCLDPARLQTTNIIWFKLLSSAYKVVSCSSLKEENLLLEKCIYHVSIKLLEVGSCLWENQLWYSGISHFPIYNAICQI